MFENEAELKKTADHVVANMLAANVAEKKFYIDEREGKEYWNLTTPNAFDKKLITIAVLGYCPMKARPKTGPDLSRLLLASIKQFCP